jgi:hypothetical protein
MANTSNTVELKKFFNQIKDKTVKLSDNTKLSFSGYTENEFLEVQSG